MFIHIDQLKIICEELGFTDVKIDSSNSQMQFEIEGEEELNQKDTQSNRKQVHGSGSDFNHLQDYDINEICSRVTITGRKK